MKLKFSNLDFTPKDINEEQKTLRAVFSTADVDRHGEVVDQKSWLLDDFLKNPVLLFGHDHSQPPIGKIVGLGYNGDGNLEGEVKFAAAEYPFANVIWNLYKGGFMKAFSVGFSAGKVDVVDGQVILKDNTLYEISTVSVPANAMALAKSKGFDVSALEEKMAADDKSDKAQHAGDECEMPNGEMGTMQMDGDEMVCMPKKEASHTGHDEKDCPCKKKEDDVVVTTAAEETPAPTEVVAEVAPAVDAEAELEKSLDVVVQTLKEGRVLSNRNRAGLVAALEAIQSVLDADKPKEDKSVISADTTDVVKTVETPAVRVAVSKKTNKARQINKAIRGLLKAKARI